MAKNRGRDRQREARWRRIIREQGRSGLSIRQFCREAKLHESAFYFWRRQLQRRQAEPEQSNRPQAGAAFVPVHVPQEARPEAARIEIELPGGSRIHVAAPVDRQVLADVLAVMLAVPSAVEGEGRPC